VENHKSDDPIRLATQYNTLKCRLNIGNVKYNNILIKPFIGHTFYNCLISGIFEVVIKFVGLKINVMWWISSGSLLFMGSMDEIDLLSESHSSSKLS